MLKIFKKKKKDEATGIVKIGFEEEKSSIQNIKEEIKASHKPLKQEIQMQKPEETDIQKLERLLEEAKLKQLEEEQRKVTEELNAEREIVLVSSNDESIKICPKCKGKIKKGTVKEDGFTLTQIFRCKSCNFEKKIIQEI